MGEAHLDHPGDWHWFMGHGPAEIIGDCPHENCPHHAGSVVAYGPDYRHYELIQCDVDEGCNGNCRGWMAEFPHPYPNTGRYVHPEHNGGYKLVDLSTEVKREKVQVI